MSILVIIPSNSLQGGPISLRITVHDGDDTEVWNYIDGECDSSRRYQGPLLSYQFRLSV